MQLLMFAASVRKESCNKKLITVAAEIARATAGVKVDLADFTELEMPLYDANMNTEIGLPSSALKFIHRLKKSTGLVIASPEYNFSMPGTLKNLIDWVSRANPQPWSKKPILLMSASPSLVGGNRGLWATRVPLECCGAHIFADMFSLASAYDAFTTTGELKDATVQNRLQTNVGGFIEYVKKLTQECESIRQ